MDAIFTDMERRLVARAWILCREIMKHKKNRYIPGDTKWKIHKMQVRTAELLDIIGIKDNYNFGDAEAKLRGMILCYDKRAYNNIKLPTATYWLIAEDDDGYFLMNFKSAKDMHESIIGMKAWNKKILCLSHPEESIYSAMEYEKEVDDMLQDEIKRLNGGNRK